jgi:hypothetical protein
MMVGGYDNVDVEVKAGSKPSGMSLKSRSM